jgi:putative ABC transport system permease protein
MNGNADNGKDQRSAPRIDAIPQQDRVPWHIAVFVSWGSIRRRFFRSMITMAGVVLAIAFLTYMQVTNDITQALVGVNDDRLNVLLQRAGVDIFSAGTADRMMILLISLSLLACLVGIMNSMLMSVSERIKEIGTLKCLGALDSFIVKTYFVESALQGVFGTLLGILVGLIVAVAVSLFSFKQYVLPNLPVGEALGSILASLLIGCLLSVFASIGPAYMAARKQPVDAMRVEE